MSLKLKSGFTFDYDNLYGEGKVTEDDLKFYEKDLKKAHEAMKVMRETGFIRAHLSKDGEPEKVLFSQLPYVEEGHLNSPSSLKHLQELTDHVKGNVDVVVSMGIGGSYLGNKVLFDVHCGAFWNELSKEERNGFPQVYFSGNNIDPRSTGDLIHHLEYESKVLQCHEKRNLKVLLLVISKSGGTLDTMSNFMVVYDALQKFPGIDVEVVAVTDPNTENPTLLKKLAIEKGWPQYAVPDGVGGRFTIFCEVGLSLAACIGFDIQSFLDGAKDMDKACQNDDIWQNPAMLNAFLKFAASEKHGRDIEVMMPYGDYLKSVSEWYIQLLAESLGKQFNKEGKEVCYGRTPLVAVGTTDMHSQTQQHQEGKLNKVVQFVKVDKWENDLKIPNVFPEAQKLADISGVTMSQALEVARQSNADALASNKRYNACFTLPELTPYHLGELLYMLAMSVAYEGELADVDAFNQPGVESYKRIMGPKLAALKAQNNE
ncbi:glucose-6-phosphate isomerase [Mitsuokella sp.]|uniref:glucose-6-phosphate isomerase n=1 Tax=Mitsuokella TaxID=52225 RepID=UPI0029E23D6F|nr:glucose-6-phosphate isomerase [Mitsuokella sp.]MDD6382296.1 glucose-6-phosphate isomerase [Selenomonadaceae bacterium]MDY4474739.1 glucose-6-phosphate isomerase [Mitsuokella sp.]